MGIRILNTGDVNYVISYFEDKIGELKSYVDTLNNKFSYLETQVNSALLVVGSINERLTEDTVEKINSLGTIEDFINGFNDGFSE
jgi:hypothetical protein